MQILTYQSFDKIDFQKPEKYIREIAHFLDGINILHLPELTKSMRRGQVFTAKQARELIQTLLLLLAPNFRPECMPPFKSPDI